jgi:hypothetical protein
MPADRTLHASVKTPLTPSEHERTSNQIDDWSGVYSFSHDRRGPNPGVRGPGAVDTGPTLQQRSAQDGIRKNPRN